MKGSALKNIEILLKFLTAAVNGYQRDPGALESRRTLHQ
jgi:hypothetical protein